LCSIVIGQKWNQVQILHFFNEPFCLAHHKNVFKLTLETTQYRSISFQHPVALLNRMKKNEKENKEKESVKKRKRMQ
jgi:hypothetical protein